MLQLFSKNHFLYTLLFFPLVVILHLAAFTQVDVYSVKVTQGEGYLGKSIVGWLEEFPRWGALLTCVLIFIQITLINRINIINKLSNKISLYAGMVYLILTMLHPEFLVFSPAVLSITFLLLGVSYLMRAFKIMNAPAHVFNTGFWIAVASLCYSSVIVYVIWGIIGFTILRRFRSVEIWRYLIGFLVPYFWIAVAVFYKGELSQFLQVQFIDNLGFADFSMFTTFQSLFPVILFTLLILYSFLNYGQITTKKSIHAQKKISIFYWLIAFAAIAIVITQNLGHTHLLFFAIPLSFLLSESLVIMNNKSVGELIMWIFVLIGIIFQYDIMV